jgi:hypothetical protein
MIMRRHPWVVRGIILWAIFLGFLPSLNAMPVPSGAIAGAENSDRAKDMAGISRALEQENVRAKLAEAGLTKEEVEGRLAAMDDHQIHLLAMETGRVEAGGDAVGFVILLCVVALLVVLVWGCSNKILSKP